MYFINYEVERRYLLVSRYLPTYYLSYFTSERLNKANNPKVVCYVQRRPRYFTLLFPRTVDKRYLSCKLINYTCHDAINILTESSNTYNSLIILNYFRYLPTDSLLLRRIFLSTPTVSI